MATDQQLRRLVFLITGCSSGLGSEIALTALRSGHKVIAVARRLDLMDRLASAGAQIFRLDVTSSLAELSQFITSKALPIHNKVDVLINNAAFMQEGAIEEASPEDTFRLYNVNVFGPLNLIRAVLPHMRENRSGVIVNIGSAGGWHATIGEALYDSTKAALASVTEGLAGELSHLNIKAICFEPGTLATSILAENHRNPISNLIPDYNSALDRDLYRSLHTNQRGDPVKAAAIIVDIVVDRFWSQDDKMENGTEWPVRIPLGGDAVPFIKSILREQIAANDQLRSRVIRTDRDY